MLGQVVVRFLWELARHPQAGEGRGYVASISGEAWSRFLDALLAVQVNPGTRVLVPLVLWALVVGILRPREKAAGRGVPVDRGERPE